jgi:hypothetical protein
MEHPQAGVWLFSDSGKFLGRMDYRARTAYGDEAALTDQLKVKAKAESDTLRSIRRIKESRADVLEEIAARDARIEILAMIQERTQQRLPASAHNRQFIEQVTDNEDDYALPDMHDHSSDDPNAFYLRLNKQSA